MMEQLHICINAQMPSSLATLEIQCNTSKMVPSFVVRLKSVVQILPSYIQPPQDFPSPEAQIPP
jgi:methylaspartate ammonia-lyase